MDYDDIGHAVSAPQTGFTDPHEYIVDVIRQFGFSCDVDEVDIDVNLDTSSIIVQFDDDEAAWQDAYNKLGFAHEMWTFTLPATEEECKRVQGIRNARGRRMFFV